LRGGHHASHRYYYHRAAQFLQHHCSTSRTIERLQAVSRSATSVRKKLSCKDMQDRIRYVHEILSAKIARSRSPEFRGRGLHPTDALVSPSPGQSILLSGGSMNPTRRQVIAGATVSLAAISMHRSWAQSSLRPDQDRVFICNEDSNTLAVMDPTSNTVAHTVNLTSFDEDPHPPFRFATGGVTPTHLAHIFPPPLPTSRLVLGHSFATSQKVNIETDRRRCHDVAVLGSLST